MGCIGQLVFAFPEKGIIGNANSLLSEMGILNYQSSNRLLQFSI